MTQERFDLAVIGGGAAGFFGALAAAQAVSAAGGPPASIAILEKGSALLGKVKVSGGGRCNVTHACYDPAQLVGFYPRGGQELRGPLHRFGPAEMIAWLAERGVPVKTEADGRIFPSSNSSQTIINTFLNEASRLGIEIRTRQPVEAVTPAPDGFLLHLRDGAELSARLLLLTSGGDRSGFSLAEQLGHTIQPPVPSLFTFEVEDPRLTGLAGLSVPAARLRLPQAGLEQTGPLLITHWGLSGPAALKLSAWGARALAQTNYQAELHIHWLSGQSEEYLYEQLLAYKNEHPRQGLGSAQLFPQLPRRLWQRFVETARPGAAQPAGDWGKTDLRRLSGELSQGRYQIQGKGVFKEEFVTCGGVTLREVNFKTMESKVQPGLYLAGEVLDIDGVTGGFNFQSAWTTAWIAGQAIAGRLR